MEAEESTGVVNGPAGGIAWRRLGQGPPLLLINGYAATKSDWDPGFLTELSGFATVICPDNRGLGDSEPGGGELTVGAMADDMGALLDGLSIPSAAVAGWSMGGFVAQQLAADAPDRVERLVLLATDCGGGSAVHTSAANFRRLIDHSGTPHEQARRLLELLFGAEEGPRIYAGFGDLVAAARAQLSAAALTAQEEAMARWAGEDAGERIAAIRAPTLAATGTSDIIIPPVNAELLAAALPDAWLARFPGRAHAFMAQEPVRLAALIKSFVAS
jgi:pimeloyl-ACP methyl ester carboxylesterase